MLADNRKREVITESAVLIILSIVSVLTGYYSSFIVLPLFALMLFLNRYLVGTAEIPSDKRLLPVFLVPYVLILLNGIATSLNLYKGLACSPEQIKIYVKIAAILIMLVLIRISGFRFADFNWKITRNQLLFTIAAGIFIAVVFLLADGSRFVNDYHDNLVDYLVYIIRIIFLTAFFEEILCRGVLISFLKGTGRPEWEANLIQAFLFGIVHMFNYLDNGLLTALLITSAHTMIGWYFGKLYLKTKTLLPGTIIHLIWDII